MTLEWLASLLRVRIVYFYSFLSLAALAGRPFALATFRAVYLLLVSIYKSTLSFFHLVVVISPARKCYIRSSLSFYVFLLFLLSFILLEFPNSLIISLALILPSHTRKYSVHRITNVFPRITALFFIMPFHILFFFIICKNSSITWWCCAFAYIIHSLAAKAPFYFLLLT